MSGSFVATDAWFEPGSAAFTRPGSPRRRPRRRRACPGRKPFDVGDRAPLRVERLARRRPGEVGLGDHERPAGREPAAGLACPRARAGRPSQYASAGSARQVPGDRDVDAPARVEAVRRATACRRSRRRGRGGAPSETVASTGSAGPARPAAVDERGVVLDAVERGELREVRDRRRDRAAASAYGRRAAGPRRPRRRWPRGPAAARGTTAARPASRRSGRIWVRTTIARSAAGGRQQLAVEAGERHGVRVQRPGREQRQRAREQGPRGEHDGQVRPAPPEHGGPEAERGGQRTFSRRVRARRASPDNNPRAPGKVPRRRLRLPRPRGTQGAANDRRRRHPRRQPRRPPSPTPTGRRASAGSPTSRGRAARRPSSCARSTPMAPSPRRWRTPRPRWWTRWRPSGGRSGQIVNGIEAASRMVAETDAALVWPARLAWVDAETVTTLIAAHGRRSGTASLRPAWQGDAGLAGAGAGRVTSTAFRGLAADPHAQRAARGPRGGGRAVPPIESATRASPTTCRRRAPDLPPYDGPPQPADEHGHEMWGAAEADQPDD